MSTALNQARDVERILQSKTRRRAGDFLDGCPPHGRVLAAHSSAPAAASHPHVVGRAPLALVCFRAAAAEYLHRRHSGAPPIPHRRATVCTAHELRVRSSRPARPYQQMRYMHSTAAASSSSRNPPHGMHSRALTLWHAPSTSLLRALAPSRVQNQQARIRDCRRRRRRRRAVASPPRKSARSRRDGRVGERAILPFRSVSSR